MENEKTSLEKLDEVLSFIATNEHALTLWNITFDYILEEVNKKLYAENFDIISRVEFELIIGRLKEDNNIQLISKNSNGKDCYTITFNGKILNETGGYVGNKKDFILQNQRIQNTEKRQYRLALILIAVAIPPSIYYIIEILRFFYSHLCCFL